MCFCYNTKMVTIGEKSVTKLFIKLTLFTPERIFLDLIESTFNFYEILKHKKRRVN
jgi:hypothetical protein